ncbi:MAG: 50S ribosomal protein L24e [DPANN group archaeon]|nr:50S ribosomal protein L24e [DPANN group archaeon]
MKCTFCGKEMEKGTGKLVVKADGKILSFCKSKCEKNSIIRNPRRVAWTEVFKEQKQTKKV